MIADRIGLLSVLLQLLICEIVNSVGPGNPTFVREFLKPMAVAAMFVFKLILGCVVRVNNPLLYTVQYNHNSLLTLRWWGYSVSMREPISRVNELHSQEPDHNIRIYVHYSLRTMCGFFNVPRSYYEQTWPSVYRPCPSRLESLMIYRCHCKGSTFSSVI